MTIRWVESREVRGSEVRERLGATVPEKGRLYVTDQFHNDWPNHPVSVYSKGVDAVILKGELRQICGDCVPQTLNRSDINNHPATVNQLRWNPNGAIELPQNTPQSSSRLSRLLTLFRR